MATAVAIAVVAAGGWSTVALVAVSDASMAYAYSMAKKAKKAGQGSSPSERKQILRSSSAPKNYIYGKIRSSGVLTFAQEQSGDQTDDEWVHLVITHAGHKIDSASDIYLNDEPITKFHGYSEYAHYPEGRTTSDPYLTIRCPDWSDKMIGEGFAWMRISLRFSQEKFPSGLPNINALKHGFRVENLITGAIEWSDNPALCILHFLRLKGWEDEYLILDTFKEAARICNENVISNTGVSEKRYTIGCEFDDSDTPASVLEKMMATCGGEWIRVGGRLGLRVAAYYGPAFIEITEDEIIDGIEIQPEVDRSESFNIVRGTFVSPEQNYTEIDYPEVKVSDWVTEDEEEIVMDMDLNYVQSPWQAQRLADIALKRSRLGMTIKLPCNMRAFQATPGTMINLSLSTIGFNKEEFMVVDWDFSIDGGVNLIVRRDMPSFYDDAVGRPIVAPPLIDLPTGGIPAPTNPLYTAKPVGDVVQGIVSWTNSAFQISHTNVIIKDTNGFILQSVQVPFPGNDMELNGKLTGSYDIDLQAVGVNGSLSSITKMSLVISAPKTPDTIAIKASNWSINLIPSYAIGTTPFGTLFEFYVDTSEQVNPPPSTRKPDEVASSWNQGGLIPDTNYYYWVRAVNSYGKSGWTKKTARTTAESDLVETLVERLVAVEIVSSNYVEGVSGYKIYGPQDPAKDGSAEFNDLIARGDIYAKSLTFLPGSTIPPEIDNDNVDTINTYKQTTEPTPPIKNGSIWYDTDDSNKQYRWSGAAWESVVDSDIVKALQDAASAQATADGKIESFFQPDPPTTGSEGDIWFDTNDGNKQYVRRSNSWVVAQDTAIGDAILAAQNAQTTADGKATTYYQASAPTGAGAGDLWIDTDDKNKPYRYSGSAWVEIRDGGVIDDGKANGELYPDQTNLTIKSGNYIQGQRGWAVDYNGNAEFNNAVIRGTLFAADIVGDIYRSSIFVNSSNLTFNSGPQTLYSFNTGDDGMQKTVVIDEMEFGVGKSAPWLGGSYIQIVSAGVVKKEFTSADDLTDGILYPGHRTMKFEFTAIPNSTVEIKLVIREGYGAYYKQAVEFNYYKK